MRRVPVRLLFFTLSLSLGQKCPRDTSNFVFVFFIFLSRLIDEYLDSLFF